MPPSGKLSTAGVAAALADASGALRKVHEQAVVELDVCLKPFGARRLGASELHDHGMQAFSEGWEFSIGFDNGQSFKLAFVVHASFPHSLPRLAVINGPDVLSWAHLEEGGLLCVLPDQGSFSPEHVADVARHLIRDAVQIINSNLSDAVEQDFKDEFVSYWNRSLGSPRHVVSLIEPRGTHRQIWMVKGETCDVVGESREDVRRWVVHRFPADKGGATVEPVPALLLWLDAPPLPSEFPHDGAGLRKTFRKDPAALALMGKAIATGLIGEVVLAATAATGVGFGSLTLSMPPAQGAPNRKYDAVGKGFRPGHVPPAIAAIRGLSPLSKVTRREVRRADHGWIHGRDHDISQDILRRKRVVIVGAGSLGSTVADLLGKAGVGDLYIIDGEALGFENIARHRLGAQWVGLAKSKALADEMRANLPHLTRVQGSDLSLADSDWDRIQSADLIIATTGSWSVDSLLDTLQQQGELPPVLYSWLEAHGLAAHAVTIEGPPASLRHGFTDAGRPLLEVTEWEQEGIMSIPACGGAFSPYGATELAWAHALVAREAVTALLSPPKAATHKIWIGETIGLRALGGRISNAWLEQMGDPGEGGLLRQRDWTAKSAAVLPDRTAA